MNEVVACDPMPNWFVPKNANFTDGDGCLLLVLFLLFPLGPANRVVGRAVLAYSSSVVHWTTILTNRNHHYACEF